MDDFIKIIKSTLGPKGYYEDPMVMAPFLADKRGRYIGQTPIIALPKTTKEVSEVVKLCNAFKIAMIPQGGNTGLCAGATPLGGLPQILVNMSRMNSVENITPGEMAISVQAGATLKAVQEAAEKKGFLFPLSLASEGSCQIGGNISTNAGGIHVLKYGAMRNLVLGLEAVLPNGKIWRGNSSLLKDNTGYDLKQLFIGAEGTLGIITQATLRLFNQPRGKCTILISAETLQDQLDIFKDLKAYLGEDIAAFEVFPQKALEFVLDHIPDTRHPFSEPSPWYGLIDIWGNDTNENLLEKTMVPIEGLLESNVIKDAVTATSIAQQNDLWKLRETLSEAQLREGASIKNDISVPPHLLAEFLKLAEREITDYLPEIRITPFGHAGDGNLHFNLMQPKNMNPDAFFKHQGPVRKIINTLTKEMGGSISAEHGIGRAKKTEFEEFSDPIAFNLMQSIKRNLDPHDLMNPGVLF